MALLKYLLPLFFIIIAFGELARFSIIPAASIGLVDIFLLLILSAWLFSVKKSAYMLKNALLAFLTIAFLSLILNFSKYSYIQLFISTLYLIRFGFYSGFYFLFRDVGQKFKSIIPRYMFFTGLIFLMIGYIQYLFVPELKKYDYLGWDIHQFRIVSSFIDPNFSGTFLVLIFIFSLGLKDKLISKKFPILFYIFLILNFIAIILTYSRGAYLMLLVCALTYSVISRRWKVLAGLVGLFAIIFIILSPKFGLESTNLLRFASLESRIISSENAIRIWKDNPMGVGFNTYRYAREKYGDIDPKLYGPSHAGAGVDNSFIFVLVTSGFLGLFAYIYLLYKLFKLGYRNIKKNKYAVVLVVSLAGLVMNALFINSLFYSFIMLWIFILAGLTESNERE